MPADRHHIVLFILISVYKLIIRGQEPSLEESIIQFYMDDKNESFSAHNCHDASRKRLPIVICSLNVAPHPIILGHDLNLNISLNISQVVGLVGEKLEVGLSIRLKTPFGYTELCDFVGDQFCHTNDLCQHLKKPTLTCPLPKGNFTGIHTKIPTKPLPFDLNGSFEATVTLKDRGKRLGCIEVKFCIGSCKPKLLS